MNSSELLQPEKINVKVTIAINSFNFLFFCQFVKHSRLWSKGFNATVFKPPCRSSLIIGFMVSAFAALPVTSVVRRLFIILFRFNIIHQSFRFKYSQQFIRQRSKCKIFVAHRDYPFFKIYFNRHTLLVIINGFGK